MGKIESCSGWQGQSCQLFGLRQPSLGVSWLSGRIDGDLQEGLHQRGRSRTAAARATVPGVSPCQCTPVQEPLQHSQAVVHCWFSLLWGHCFFPLGLGAHNILFVLSKVGVSVSPQSCGSPVIKSCWPLSSDSLGIPSSFCWIPSLRSLTWGSELLQQWENFFAISVLLFVGHPPRGYGI